LFIEISADEDELIAARRVIPSLIRLSVEEHVHTLKHKTTRLAGKADESLHPEDVHTTFTEELAQPRIQPVSIDIAIPLDGD
jgi:hypothetical protein